VAGISSLSPIQGRAVKVKGPKHEQGGVMVAPNAEVEGGETIDQVQGTDYVFSDRLMVPNTNMTFAQMHEKMLQEGATEQEIQQLAQLQEQVAGRQGQDPMTQGQDPMTQGDPIMQQDPMMQGQAPVGEEGQMMMASGGPIDPMRRISNYAPLGAIGNNLPLPQTKFQNMNKTSANSGNKPFNLRQSGIGLFNKGLGLGKDILKNPDSLDYLAPALNIATSIFSKPKIPKLNLGRVDDSQANALRSERNNYEVDINPQLNDINASERGIQAQNLGSNTNLAARAQSLSAKARLYSEKRNQERLQKNNLLSTEMQIRNANQLANMQAQGKEREFQVDAEMARSAERRGMFTAGINQITNTRLARRSEGLAADASAQNILLGLIGKDAPITKAMLGGLAQNPSYSPNTRKQFADILRRLENGEALENIIGNP
jgi:hypothetical protein